MINKSKESYLFLSLIQKPTLVYLFENETCWDCVYKDLDYLEKIGKEIGKQNIVVIGQQVNPNFLFRSDSFASWKNRLYQTRTPLFPNNQKLTGQSLYFVVTPNGEIKLAQYSSKNSTAANEQILTHFKQHGL